MDEVIQTSEYKDKIMINIIIPASSDKAIEYLIAYIDKFKERKLERVTVIQREHERRL